MLKTKIQQTKGQLILKPIYDLLTSLKKRTDEFDLLAFLLITANKSNSSVHFLGESAARQSAFRFIYLTQVCNRYFVKFKVSEEADAISHFFWLRCVRYNSKKPVFLYVAGVIQLLNLSFSHQVGGQQHQKYF